MSDCIFAWNDAHDRIVHTVHCCVFNTQGCHSRHECRCGLERVEVPA